MAFRVTEGACLGAYREASGETTRALPSKGPYDSTPLDPTHRPLSSSFWDYLIVLSDSKYKPQKRNYLGAYGYMNPKPQALNPKRLDQAHDPINFKAKAPRP